MRATDKLFHYNRRVSDETWLITGGAGYIGSHIADSFLNDGKNVVIYDSLYRGLESRIEYLRRSHHKELSFIQADIRDADAFRGALQKFRPDGVVHAAALKSVSESIEKPDEYFEVNYHATNRILEAVISSDVHQFIFSSTAAVYGSPAHSNPIKEDDPKNPISPYGESKLSAELMVNDFLGRPGNFGTSLRFFNVIGANSIELSDNSVDNIVPIVIDKLKRNESPTIYGVDYLTPDGTCIRDYVDVHDIALAHLAVANSSQVLPFAINVGTGRGTSVRDVINLVCKTADCKDVTLIESGRRAGDSAVLYADVTRMLKVLGIKSTRTTEEAIRTLF
jgi:UDP-glucose 4-epimerase